VWQDRRTADVCQQLASSGANELVANKTGLVIDAYFCATKIAWILDHVPGARRRAETGELAVGTVDSWLIYNLTGGRLHVSDVTNCSRTMLMNTHTSTWDDELLELFRVPRNVLPKILPSMQVYGETDGSLFGSPIPIGGAAGDQQAALFGQNCTCVGMAKNTYGTGCFILTHLGNQAKPSKCKLLTTVACSDSNVREYAYEGSVFIAGAAVQWLRDGMGVIEKSADVEALATRVSDTDGLYFVPALTGLGAPYWDPYARGLVIGISRGTTRAHLARAALEGIAYQVADVLDAMKRDAGTPIQELRVDGGATANNFLMQFQADLLQVPVVRPAMVETTAAGAAFLAGLSTGFWKNRDELGSIWRAERVFEPSMKADEVAQRRNRWRDAVNRCRGWETGS
jgi:glycerol kinase